MKLQKVIHILSDGRRKYSTHNGELEKWDERDINALKCCREKFGDSAYTADFSKYAATAADLRRRFPKARIVRVVGFETEDYNDPLRNDIIF